VDRDTYQELGLSGKLSRFKLNRDDRYNIRVDILSDDFRPGKKLYQRVCGALLVAPPLSNSSLTGL